MSVVSLVSGGFDSSVMSLMAAQEKVEQYPLFVNYGQRAVEQEWSACTNIFRRCKLPAPVRMDVSGFGAAIPCGITDPTKDVFEEAFLPGRNLLFLLCGASYATHVGANGVLIGLLNEATHLFPDQTRRFLVQAEQLITTALGRPIQVVAPLFDMFKEEVLQLAEEYGLSGTYSCHSGNEAPCGQCVACRELISAQNNLRG